jgi:hypothetical protein
MEQTHPQNTNDETDRKRVSAVIESTEPENKGGRPTKYEPATVDRILAAIADGLNLKQACIASGICQNTLATWREKYPELEQRFSEAREQARQKALAGIRAAGEAGDWRALEAFLRMSFPADYRRDSNINVSATAGVQQSSFVISAETAERLQERHKRLLEETRK